MASKQEILDATLHVLIGDQAYLYALLMSKTTGLEVSEEQFEAWQDDWKEQTAWSIHALLEKRASGESIS